MNNNNNLEGNRETEQNYLPQQGWDSEAIEDGTCDQLTQSPGYIFSGPVGELTIP